MPNLLRRFLASLKDDQPPKPNPLGEHIQRQLTELDAPVTIAPAKPKPRGRVIKQTRHSEFNPDPNRTGGRIVKVMPRQLQKIKAAQEKVEDDDQPSVTDLEE